MPAGRSVSIKQKKFARRPHHTPDEIAAGNASSVGPHLLRFLYFRSSRLFRRQRLSQRVRLPHAEQLRGPQRAHVAVLAGGQRPAAAARPDGDAVQCAAAAAVFRSWGRCRRDSPAATASTRLLQSATAGTYALRVSEG